MEVDFVTAHSTYKILNFNDHQTLQELCVLNKIPITNVTFYGVKNANSSVVIGQYEKIKNFQGQFDKIIIRSDRNIDYWAVCRKNVKYRPSATPVAEYTFPGNNASELHHFEFSENQCKDYVSKRVTEFFRTEVVVNPETKIVIGISGGGDSNTLIEAFLQSGKVTAKQIIAVMMLGIPDWDKGKPRAEAICEKHNVELRFVDSAAVNKLLRRKNGGDWVEDFEKVFPDADLEALGTLAVRLALISTAKQVNAQSIVTGLNLEDILAECILATIQGETPPAFPVRIIDGIPLWYPLYNIPKKILDGCNPRYSLANYVDRYPGKMLSRANVYYFAQMMNSLNPGTEFDLLDGFKKIASKNPTESHFDDDLGFSTDCKIPAELKSRWQFFLQM